MDKKKRRQFELEEKQKAVARAKEIGFRAAGKELGINENQLQNWARGERLSPIGGSKPGVPHASYDDDFKRKALDLAAKVGVPQAAKQLGVHNASLYQWRKGTKGAPKNGGLHARSSKGTSTNGTPNLEVEAFVAYTWGGLERDIKTFARSQHVPEEIVAGRLGEILRGKARGHVLRA